MTASESAWDDTDWAKYRQSLRKLAREWKIRRQSMKAKSPPECAEESRIAGVEPEVPSGGFVAAGYHTEEP